MASHAVLPPGEYSNNLYHRKKIAYLVARSSTSEAKPTRTLSTTRWGTRLPWSTATRTRQIDSLGEAIEDDDPGISEARNAFAVELAKAESLMASVNQVLECRKPMCPGTPLLRPSDFRRYWSR
jgi:hypothetical protein